MIVACIYNCTIIFVLIPEVFFFNFVIVTRTSLQKTTLKKSNTPHEKNNPFGLEKKEIVFGYLMNDPVADIDKTPF